MNALKQMLMGVIEWIIFWLKHCLQKMVGVFSNVSDEVASTHIIYKGSGQAESEKWKTSEALRTYYLGNGAKVTVRTTTHTFHVSI